jgi:hypothetical protein
MATIVIDGVEVKSIDGLTDRQMRAVEAACRTSGRPEWHDGIIDDVAAALAGSPPYSDARVTAAIASALADLGLDVPFSL